MKKLATIIVEMTAGIGLCMLAYGLWLIAPPAMFTTMGIIFISMSILLHRGLKTPNHGG